MREIQPSGRELRPFTTERIGDGVAYEIHLFFAELGQSWSYARLRDSHNIVKIDDARCFHPVIDVQRYLGGNTANRRSDRRDRDLRKILHGLPAREQQDWPRLVRRRELVEADLAAL